MAGRGSIERLGAEWTDRVAEWFAAGGTVDAITAALNDALERAGRPERISRSAVGRQVRGLDRILAVKRRADAVMGALAEQPSEGRRELVRALITEAGMVLADTDEDAPAVTPAQAKDLSAALLNVERAGEIDDKRLAAAARRAREAERARAREAERARAREALAEAGGDGRLDPRTAERALAVLGLA